METRRKARANVTSDSYSGSESYRYSRRYSAPAVLGHQPVGMSAVTASFPFSIGLCNEGVRSRTMVPLCLLYTWRIHAVMATLCGIRERLDQRSIRAGKIARRYRARIPRLFVNQDVTEIQQLVVYLAGWKCMSAIPRGNVILIPLRGKRLFHVSF